MQEVPGQPSCKCGPAPHLISAHQAGRMHQAASVLQMLCETGPHPCPPLYPCPLWWEHTGWLLQERAWGSIPHPHRTGKAAVLVSGGHRRDALLDPPTSEEPPAIQFGRQADSSLSCPLSILRPPSETPIVCYPYVPHSHPLVWYLQRKSECRWESVVLTRLGRYTGLMSPASSGGMGTA